MSYKNVEIICREHWLKDDLHLSVNAINRLKEWIDGLSDNRFEKVIWYQYLNEKGENEVVFDDYRFQLTKFKNNADYFTELLQQIQAKLNTICRDLKIVYKSVWWSKPNGPTQREHQDYPALDFPLFSIIVTLDDSKTLDIVEGVVKRRKIRLLSGECLIFTGELLHAGSSYSVSNRRHFSKPFLSIGTYRKRMIMWYLPLGYIVDFATIHLLIGIKGTIIKE